MKIEQLTKNSIMNSLEKEPLAFMPLYHASKATMPGLKVSYFRQTLDKLKKRGLVHYSPTQQKFQLK